MTNIDWFYVAVIVVLFILQVHTAYWLFRCRELIDEQSAALIEANEGIIALRSIIDQQDAHIRLLTAARGGPIGPIADVNEMPPDARTALRDYLSSTLAELRKMDN
jgi:hypothetical protein